MSHPSLLLRGCDTNSSGCNVMKYTKALVRMWWGISAAQLLNSYKVKPNLADPSIWNLIYKCLAPFGGSCPNYWSKAERNQIMMNYCWDMIDVSVSSWQNMPSCVIVYFSKFFKCVFTRSAKLWQLYPPYLVFVM